MRFLLRRFLLRMRLLRVLLIQRYCTSFLLVEKICTLSTSEANTIFSRNALGGNIASGQRLPFAPRGIWRVPLAVASMARDCRVFCQNGVVQMTKASRIARARHT